MIVLLYTDNRQVRGQRKGKIKTLLSWARSHDLDRWEIHENCGLSPSAETLIAHDDNYWAIQEKKNQHVCNCGQGARYKAEDDYLCADCAMKRYWDKVKIHVKPDKPWLAW